MNCVKTVTGAKLMMRLGTENHGRLLGFEPVTMSDLYPARDEAWCRALRSGALGENLGELSVRIWPGENTGPDALAGFTLELSNGARSYRRHFPMSSLSAVARRGGLRLMKDEALQAGDTFAYALTTVPDNGDEPSARGNAPSARHRFVAPVFEPRPLSPLLASSTPLYGNWALADEEDQFVPVFAEEEVWKQGQDMARRGGDKESAAVWTGALFRDTDSPEIFMTLDACLEAEHAQEEQFAVTFSGATWARVREVLDIRRQRLNRPHERILGSVHGHNFMPEADDKGRRTCEHCLAVKLCTRTTAAASQADLDWHRSVFVAQPWALLMVWGYNAREEEDWQLYGLSGGTLTPRGIRLSRE